VVECLAAYTRVGVADAAEPVVVVLKRVAVDHADAHAEVGGVLGQRGVVLDGVPRDVQRHARRGRGEAVHLRGVGQLLERVPGHAWLREHLETRTGVAVGPGGDLDLQVAQARLDVDQGGHDISSGLDRVADACPAF